MCYVLYLRPELVGPLGEGGCKLSLNRAQGLNRLSLVRLWIGCLNGEVQNYVR